MKKTLLLFLIAAMRIISVNAQLTESFDGLVFPPAGWTSVVISVGNGENSSPGGPWDRATSNSEDTNDPVVTPHSGAGMAWYDSYDFDSLSKADLITPAMDFTAGPKQVSFWMYRSGSLQTEDSITVYVNTAASSTGATFLGTVHRVRNRPPVVGANGWYQYTFEIPASFNGASNYIIFRASGEYGISMFIDDVSVTSQPTCRPVTAITASNYNYAAGTATITWTPPTGNPTGYEWSLNTTGTVPSSGTAITGTTLSLTGITSNVVNHIFVRTSCGGGDFSTWDSLAFAALPCAALTVPANLATNIAQPITFSWDAVTGATGYLFYLGTTAANITALGATPNTTVSLPGFLPLQTYYWFVTPILNGAVAPASCTANSFTTGEESTKPANNPCSGAIPITAANIAGNAITSTTVGATISLPVSNCNGDSGGFPDDDVWFEFTTSAATPTGTLTITPAGTRGITDIVAQVYAANSCTNLGAPVICADQTTTNEPEVINLSALSPNTHYFMRVYSWNDQPADRGAFSIVASGGSTLPITLGSFTARRSNGVNILNWSTEQELNSRYFAIERSNDGRNFTSIGQVSASGNSNTERRYTFTDSRPSKGTNFYRLRTVDADNASKLSVIRSIRNQGIADIALYPNPVKDRLTLNINADKASRGQLLITDMSGKTIYSRSVQLPEGNTLLPVVLGNVAAGSYILKIQLDDDVIVKKFNKQ